MPAVNWALIVAVAALVVGFGSSAALAAAYGIAVTGTLAIDTILFFVVVRTLWGRPLWLAIAGAAAFLVVDLAFFGRQPDQDPPRRLVPAARRLGRLHVLITWQRGRAIVTRNRREEEGPLRDFVDELDAMDPPINRVPGTAVFLNANLETTPLALRANVEHNKVLHESVVVLSIETENVPHVGRARAARRSTTSASATTASPT